MYIFQSQYAEDGMTWYLVQYSGQWGFVRADLVRVMGEQETAEYLAALEAAQATPTPMPQATPEPLGPNATSAYAKLIKDAVNLRRTPSASGTSLGRIAVNTLLLQLFTLFSYMNDGFAYAAEALTGRFIGARDEGALRDCLRRCIAWGTVVSVLFVGIYIGWWRELVGLFVDSTAPNAATIVELAGEYIVWIILIPVASAMPFIMDGIMVGATETRVMRNSMFWATAAYFGIFYVGYAIIGNNALWLAFTLYMFLRGVLQYFMTHRLRSIYVKATV